jgi:general secretion pathway protein B
MSYILDALQKSEQERKQQTLPDLHAEPLPAAPTSRRNLPWAISIGVLLVGLNMGALWYWLAVPGNPTEITPVATATLQPAQTIEQVNPKSSRTSPANETETQASNQPTDIPLNAIDDDARQRVTPSDFRQLDKLRVVTPQRITELPVFVQQQIPALTFSSHLYSDDFRMVNINGRMMREGETIAPGLTLLEITEDGVILSFGEYQLQMSILQNWSFE